MDLSPRGIRTHLGLNKPIYTRTSAYGHFGRAPEAERRLLLGEDSISSTNCGAPSETFGGRRVERRLGFTGAAAAGRCGPAKRCSTDDAAAAAGSSLPLPRASLDPAPLFAEPPRAIWLEIGFGGGEHLAEQAEPHPEIGFIGCEVFENGVAKLLGADRAARGSRNIRIFTDDARLLIAALPPASIGRVFILFPDPWPKRAPPQAPPRLAPTTLDGLARIMTGGAELRLATDDRDYLVWMLDLVTAHPAFDWTARRPADWRERPARLAARPATRKKPAAPAALPFSSVSYDARAPHAVPGTSRTRPRPKSVDKPKAPPASHSAGRRYL